MDSPLLTPADVCARLALRREDGSPDLRALRRILAQPDAPRVVWILARVWRMPVAELDAYLERRRGTLSFRVAKVPPAPVTTPQLVVRRRRKA